MRFSDIYGRDKLLLILLAWTLVMSMVLSLYLKRESKIYNYPVFGSSSSNIVEISLRRKYSFGFNTAFTHATEVHVMRFVSAGHTRAMQPTYVSQGQGGET